MAKGNGNTRGGSSSSPQGLGNNTQASARAIEDEVKRSFADDRERTIAELKETRRNGKVGEIVNAEIDRAITNTETALKEYESVNTITELYEAETKLGNRLRSVVARLSVVADNQEHNSGYAYGRNIRTLNDAAGALRVTALEISKIVDNYRTRSERLIQLESLFRSQNRWK